MSCFFKCPMLCGSVSSSVAVLVNEEFRECSICLEEIFDREVRCSNRIDHPCHRECVDLYASQFFTTQEVDCPLKCGGVFRGVFGRMETELSIGEFVPMVIEDLDDETRAVVLAAAARFEQLPSYFRGRNRRVLPEYS